MALLLLVPMSIAPRRMRWRPESNDTLALANDPCTARAHEEPAGQGERRAGPLPTGRWDWLEQRVETDRLLASAPKLEAKPVPLRAFPAAMRTDLGDRTRLSDKVCPFPDRTPSARLRTGAHERPPC
jgi:hypothetical protein